MHLAVLALPVAALVAAEVTADSIVVVINGASTASAQVARAWMRLCGIADDRAVVLDGVPVG